MKGSATQSAHTFMNSLGDENMNNFNQKEEEKL